MSQGFPCPVCGSDSSVVDSRRAVSGAYRRRRYRCLEGSHAFTTREQVHVEEPPITDLEQALLRAKAALILVDTIAKAEKQQRDRPPAA
jgi:transcriptional regulator NrdR family protein